MSGANGTLLTAITTHEKYPENGSKETLSRTSMRGPCVNHVREYRSINWIFLQNQIDYFPCRYGSIRELNYVRALSPHWFPQYFVRVPLVLHPRHKTSAPNCNNDVPRCTLFVQFNEHLSLQLR